jgi:glutamate-1-semialdehyde 2,1-aminomutase
MESTRTREIGRKLHTLIPGGAHTYTKGDDQWPDNAPKCIARGKGATVWDADGNRFIDWSMGLTSVCVGHAHDGINQAAIDAMALGLNFQRPATIEVEAAERLLNFLEDRGDMVKFAKNGSVVTTAAVKLARAHTGRAKVAICAQHPFFSYDDWFIGSTKCPAGVPDPFRDLTVSFNYNDIESAREMFARNKGQVAALILEPVKFDRPANGFLQELYQLCKEQGTVFILDEMVTGFKWHKRGAGAFYGADADLYTWGKGLANGHSVCALTGRREIMELGGIHHDKPRVFLSSTTHGAEIPQLAAMIATLDYFDQNAGTFEKNWQTGREIRRTLGQMIAENELSGHLRLIGEDCFVALSVENTAPHKANVARTFFLQEMIKEGQLFQGLFYPIPAHIQDILDETFRAWKVVLPRFRKFMTSGSRADLIGEPTRPVFRKYNSCECLSPSDCAACVSGKK